MPSRYLTIPYKDGGRTAEGCDCWGLTRLVRHQLYNKPLMPPYGHLVLADEGAETRANRDLGMQTVVAEEQSTRLRECAPCKGAIVFAYKGKMCRHVAVIVEAEGLLRVMSIHPDTGVYIQPISHFARKWSKVAYYSEAA